MAVVKRYKFRADVGYGKVVIVHPVHIPLFLEHLFESAMFFPTVKFIFDESAKIIEAYSSLRRYLVRQARVVGIGKDGVALGDGLACALSVLEPYVMNSFGVKIPAVFFVITKAVVMVIKQIEFVIVKFGVANHVIEEAKNIVRFSIEDVVSVQSAILMGVEENCFRVLGGLLVLETFYVKFYFVD